MHLIGLYLHPPRPERRSTAYRGRLDIRHARVPPGGQLLDPERRLGAAAAVRLSHHGVLQGALSAENRQPARAPGLRALSHCVTMALTML